MCGWPLVVTIPVYNDGPAGDWRCSFDENVGRASITWLLLWIVLYSVPGLLSKLCFMSCCHYCCHCFVLGTMLAARQSASHRRTGKRWEHAGVGVGGGILLEG